MGNYKKIYDNWQKDPKKFWKEQSQNIHWEKNPEEILNDDNKPFYKWYTDGSLNTCFNAIDRHVINGRGEQDAILYDSPVTNTKKKITYSELKYQVSIFAGALKKLGVLKGDRVIIYMPMIPEALVAMLACSRLGAIHSVVFGGFASNELAVRIDDCKPKIIVSASCGHEPNRIVEYKPLLDNAVKIASHQVEKCIIYQREALNVKLIPGQDIDWNEVVKDVSLTDPVEVSKRPFVYFIYIRNNWKT